MLTQNQTIENGRYTITASRNSSYGRSYEAFDNELRRNVLLKEISYSSSYAVDTSQTDNNSNEFAELAETISKFDHPSLEKIINHFPESGRHYLVVEINRGKTLGKLFEKKQNPFTTNDIINWTDQLLDAVGFLHSQSPPLFHLDIRPKNILLTSEGKVKLSLLNLIQNSDPQKFAVSESELFESKNLAFSPLEQIWSGLDVASQNVILNSFDEQSHKILEKQPAARSDIYSLGATVYYLLTREMPGDSLSRLIEMLDGNEDPLIAPHKVNAKIPLEVSEVILKALEIKREERFNSATIMRQVFRTALNKVKERRAKEEMAQRMVSPKPVATPPIATQATPIGDTVKSNTKATVESLQKSEEPSQLEIIKTQLRKAEQRRLEAEKRAIEAERLLNEKAKQNPIGTVIPESNENKTPEVVASTFNEQKVDAVTSEFISNEVEKTESLPLAEKRAEESALVKETENIEKAEPAENPEVVMATEISEIEQNFPVSEYERPFFEAEASETSFEERDDLLSTEPVLALTETTKTKTLTEADVDLDYFDELYDKPEPVKERKSYFKMIAGALVLLLIGGAAFATLNFYGTNAIIPTQAVTSEEKVPAVTEPENTTAPESEANADALVTDSESVQTDEDADDAIVGEETEENLEPKQTVTAQPATTTPNRPAKQTRVARPQEPSRPVAKRKTRPKVDKPAPKPKPTQKPKKSVTLDDLLKDN